MGGCPTGARLFSYSGATWGFAPPKVSLWAIIPRAYSPD